MKKSHHKFKPCKRSKRSEITDYLDKQEVLPLIRRIEELAIHAVKDHESPYHLVLHERFPEKDKPTKEYHAANFPYIMQDFITTPIAESIIDLMKIERIFPNGEYHFLGDRNEILFNSSQLKKRSPAEPIFDAQKIGKKLVAETGMIESIDEENLKKNSSILHSFPIATSTGRFRGINLDMLTWLKFTNNLNDILCDYISEKYNMFSKSYYFKRPCVVLNRDYSVDNPDIYVGTGFQIQSCIFGERREPEIIPQNHQQVQNYQYTESEPQDAQPNRKWSAIIKSIASNVMAVTESEFNKIINNEKSEYKKEKKDKIIFEFGKIVDEYLPYQVEEALTAWIRGMYFNKEGAFNTQLSRVAVIPQNITLATDWIDENRMAGLTSEIWAKTFDYLAEAKKNECSRIMLSSGCVSYCLLYKNTEPSIQPIEIVQIRSLANHTHWLITETFEKMLNKKYGSSEHSSSQRRIKQKEIYIGHDEITLRK